MVITKERKLKNKNNIDIRSIEKKYTCQKEIMRIEWKKNQLKILWSFNPKTSDISNIEIIITFILVNSYVVTEWGNKAFRKCVILGLTNKDIFEK